MGLRLKFNLVMGTVFVVGLALLGYVFHGLLQNRAQQEIARKAELIMETALAIRGYTNDQVRPHLLRKLAETFLPQTVPAYAATETLAVIRQKYPNYLYKEAALNPTNPRDQATPWEAALIEQFRTDRALERIVTERKTDTGHSLYIARPIEITERACLGCHSLPEAAPASMRAVYGNDNGFGWEMNEIVGAQLVAVPMSLPIQEANKAFFTIMGSLVAVFAIMFIVLNVMLSQMVIKPVTAISRTADQVSTGDFSIAEFSETGQDEMTVLASSFNRMRRSLEKAMTMLQE